MVRRITIDEIEAAEQAMLGGLPDSFDADRRVMIKRMLMAAALVVSAKRAGPHNPRPRVSKRVPTKHQVLVMTAIRDGTFRPADSTLVKAVRNLERNGWATRMSVKWVLTLAGRRALVLATVDAIAGRRTRKTR